MGAVSLPSLGLGVGGKERPPLPCCQDLLTGLQVVDRPGDALGEALGQHVVTCGASDRNLGPHQDVP